MDSFAPFVAFTLMAPIPTAYAVGYILGPLRGEAHFVEIAEIPSLDTV